VVSARDDRSTILTSFRLGAAGYIVKTSPPAVMAAAIRLVVHGGLYVPPEALPDLKATPHQEMVDPAIALVLTSRQKEVLRLLMQGLSTDRIAHELGISKSTVKHHAMAIYDAFRVSNRAELQAAITRGKNQY
jgi:DNA-binding NarL/FixJ family response regulator